MDQDAGKTEAVARLEKAVTELGEHFETVMIFASRHESSDGGTFRAIKGSGNWFARYGQVREWLVREWLVREEETSRFNARKDAEQNEG